MTDDNQIELGVETSDSDVRASRDGRPSDSPARCAATTTRGTRCKNNALPDSEYCAIHRRLLAAEGPPPETPPADEPTVGESVAGLSDAELRARLREELKRLVDAFQVAEPDFTPPPFSPEALIRFLRENLGRLRSEERLAMIGTLRESLEGDYFDVDTWKGIWYMLHYTLEYQADVVQNRLTGSYEVTDYGLDEGFREAVKPFFTFLYRYWWRVEAIGLENVPDEGRVLMVSNHSGILPWDGSMIAAAIDLEHPNPRIARPLVLNWFPTLPFVSVLLERSGALLGTPENAERLLEEDELVLVFPEGIGGVGKLFKNRYRLARFGRGGFARSALRTGAPIVPVAVVGAEEIYPMLGRSKIMARLLKFPFFPITPTWPWLGLLGTVPLPTKWVIGFGEPIETVSLGPESADDLSLVAELSDLVRNRIQAMLLEQLAQRRSIF